jgi:Protein of unknown function (DUF2786).
MTKSEAAEKVAKLRRLAKGTSNEHEASSAKAKADKLVEEHSLNENDLSSGEKAAAFDDLIDTLHLFVANHPALPNGLFGTSAILGDVLKKIKTIEKTDKANRLSQLTTIVRTASFIAGDNPSIREIKRIVDDTLFRHEIKL